MIMEILLPGSDNLIPLWLVLLILAGLFIAYRKQLLPRVFVAREVSDANDAPLLVSTAPPALRVRANLKRIKSRKPIKPHPNTITRQPPVPIQQNPYLPLEERPVLTRRLMQWEQGKIPTR